MKTKSKAFYTNEDLVIAVEKVRSGELSQSQAARDYGIPRTTLRSKVFGLTPITSKVAPKHFSLTEEEECILLTSLKKSQRRDMPITKETILHKVEEIIKSNGSENGLNQRLSMLKSRLGCHWYKYFIQCHPEFTIQESIPQYHYEAPECLKDEEENDMCPFNSEISDYLEEEPLMHSEPVHFLSLDYGCKKDAGKIPRPTIHKGTQTSTTKSENIDSAFRTISYLDFVGYDGMMRDDSVLGNKNSYLETVLHDLWTRNCSYKFMKSSLQHHQQVNEEIQENYFSEPRPSTSNADLVDLMEEKPYMFNSSPNSLPGKGNDYNECVVGSPKVRSASKKVKFLNKKSPQIKEESNFTVPSIKINEISKKRKRRLKLKEKLEIEKYAIKTEADEMVQDQEFKVETPENEDSDESDEMEGNDDPHNFKVKVGSWVVVPVKRKMTNQGKVIRKLDYNFGHVKTVSTNCNGIEVFEVHYLEEDKPNFYKWPKSNNVMEVKKDDIFIVDKPECKMFGISLGLKFNENALHTLNYLKTNKS